MFAYGLYSFFPLNCLFNFFKKIRPRFLYAQFAMLSTYSDQARFYDDKTPA